MTRRLLFKIVAAAFAHKPKIVPAAAITEAQLANLSTLSIHCPTIGKEAITEGLIVDRYSMEIYRVKWEAGMCIPMDEPSDVNGELHLAMEDLPPFSRAQG